MDAVGLCPRHYALEALSGTDTVCLYWGEIDAAGHRWSGSDEWLRPAGELELGAASVWRS